MTDPDAFPPPEPAGEKPKRQRRQRDDGQRLGEKPLSRREQHFVQAYVDTGQIKAAALAAGYKASFAQGSAYLLLRRAPVIAAVEAEVAARRRHATVTQGRIIAELAKVAFADPRDLFTADGQLKPIHALDDAGAANIAALDVVVSAAARTAAARSAAAGAQRAGADDSAGEPAALPPAELRKIKCWDKTRALELLGRTLGLFKDRVEMEVTEDLAAAIEAARKRAGAVVEEGAEDDEDDDA
jgi:phage terminase small subunit